MIAHIDADAFFASALQRKRPDLRGKPLLALGAGGGCVIAASYEAKAFGVKTGMRLKDARKLCPQGIAVPSDFSEALLCSRQIEKVLSNQCPVMEQMSVDEWFLDLATLRGGIPKHLDEWASEIQKEVSRSVGLTVSVGIAPTKLLAKMASEYHKPAGVTIVKNEKCTDLSIEIFLKDRPAAAIPGIGHKRQAHAEFYNWKTAWDIAHAEKETVVHLFGKPGLDMQKELLGTLVDSIGEDTRPPQSISRCRSFRKIASRSHIFAHLLHHLSYTILKMRRHHLGCKEVAVWLRNGEYTYDTQRAKLPQLADTEEQLLPYIRICFEHLIAKHKQCTQVGLGLMGLKPKEIAQYSLFEEPKKTDNAEQIQQVLDQLHNRYGRETITRGSAMEQKNEFKRKLYALD